METLKIVLACSARCTLGTVVGKIEAGKVLPGGSGISKCEGTSGIRVQVAASEHMSVPFTPACALCPKVGGIYEGCFVL